jgi:hypothetical protein
MELINDEILFNPDPTEVGKKIFRAINNQYDVLIEKTDNFELQIRVLKRKFL